MRLHRHAHSTNYWGTVFTEWPRPPEIELQQASSIRLGWIFTLGGQRAGERDGAGTHWEVALCLGAMALPGETPDGEQHGIACVLLRPLVGPALDHARLCAAYEAWHSAKTTAWARGDDGPTADRFTSLSAVLLEPHAGPANRAERFDAQESWKTVTDAWQQVEDFQAAAACNDAPHRSAVQLLQDHPYLLAYQDTPQRLWDPDQRLVKPSTDSGLDRVRLPQAPAEGGRPRSFDANNLSMAITDCLVTTVGRKLRAEQEDFDGVRVDMRAVFALELVLHGGDRTHRVARERVHRWILGGNERAATAADLRRRSRALRTKLKYVRNVARGGRSNTPAGAREVRKVVPTLIFDRSVFLKPWGDDGTDPRADTDATLVDWLRSPRVEELMDIVTGRRKDMLQMACVHGSFADFMGQRGLPFHRLHVRFEPGEDGYRRSVAMLPEAQPGAPVVLDLTGFAEDPDELRWRWFGEPMGEVLSIRTVQAGQPWPPLDSSITSPPPPSPFGT